MYFFCCVATHNSLLQTQLMLLQNQSSRLWEWRSNPVRMWVILQWGRPSHSGWVLNCLFQLEHMKIVSCVIKGTVYPRMTLWECDIIRVFVPTVMEDWLCFLDKAETEGSWDRREHEIDMESAAWWECFLAKTLRKKQQPEKLFSFSS